jgi:hypothetical protein
MRAPLTNAHPPAVWPPAARPPALPRRTRGAALPRAAYRGIARVTGPGRWSSDRQTLGRILEFLGTPKVLDTPNGCTRRDAPE